jgi:hypothetical protein
VQVRSSWAWRRVGRWAAHSHLCNELFGVMRTGALRHTHLLADNLVSPDMVLLTELAALGRFVEVPEELFFRRMHPAGTHQGDRTLDEIASFLEPNAPRRQLARYAITRETVRVLWDSHAAMPTRLSTIGAFLARYSSRRIKSRLRRYVERVLGLAPRAAPWEAVPPMDQAAPAPRA